MIELVICMYVCMFVCMYVGGDRNFMTARQGYRNTRKPSPDDDEDIGIQFFIHLDE